MQDLLVDAIGRGLVKFELIKNIQSRGASDSDPYPFSDINKVDIKIQNMDTKKTQEFKSLKVTYVEDFDDRGIGYRTSVGRLIRLLQLRLEITRFFRMLHIIVRNFCNILMMKYWVRLPLR